MSDMRSLDEDMFLAQAKWALDDTVQRWGWAAGVAVTSIGLLIVLLANRPDMDNHGQPLLEDVELMASPENAELSEDLEFYDWLADSTTNG